MSLHLVNLSENITGQRRRLVFDVSFIGPYPFGGEPLNARRLQLWQVDDVQVSPQYGFWFGYNRQTSSLQVYTLDIFETAQDLGVFFTEPGDPVNAPLKIPAGAVASTDIPVFFTEAGDPVNAPAKVVAGTRMGVPGHEVAVGIDMSALQHVIIVAEGF